MKNSISTSHFSVTLNGNFLWVSEVSGLNIYVESLESREGPHKEQHVQKTPGNTRYDNIILKRVLSHERNEFYDFMKSSFIESVKEMDMTISLLNKAHEPTITWRCRNVFPVRYSFPILNAISNEVGMEELELAVEALDLRFES